MTGTSREPSAGWARAGFTIVELLIYMVVGSVLLLGVYGMMLSQGQVFSVQRSMMDVQQTLRSGGHLLAWELRQLSPSGGDVYQARPTSITLRSYTGSAVVCTQNTAGAIYGLYHVEGDPPAVGDSVVVFLPGGVGPGDDQWRAYAVAAAGAPGGMGMAACDYPAAPVPQHGVRLNPPGAAGGIVVGSFVRGFHRVQYGAHMSDGRWWLGRRVQGSAWESLAGPLADSTALSFTYRDASGSVTATPSAIAVIDIVIRGESAAPAQVGNWTALQDTVSFKVFVRG